jgi:hypothetical protein
MKANNGTRKIRVYRGIQIYKHKRSGNYFCSAQFSMSVDQASNYSTMKRWIDVAIAGGEIKI